MVALRCLRLVLRRMALRKGVTLSVSIFILAAFFCVYYLVANKEDGERKIRTVHAVCMLLSICLVYIKVDFKYYILSMGSVQMSQFTGLDHWFQMQSNPPYQIYVEIKRSVQSGTVTCSWNAVLAWHHHILAGICVLSVCHLALVSCPAPQTCI